MPRPEVVVVPGGIGTRRFTDGGVDKAGDEVMERLIEYRCDKR